MMIETTGRLFLTSKLIRIVISAVFVLQLTLFVFAEEGAKKADKNAEAAQRLFDAHVAAIFEQHCVKCHGDRKKRNKLDLRSMQSIIAGGVSGTPVKAGKPAESLLVEMLDPNHEDRMPPEGKGRPLNNDEKHLIGEWIKKLPSPENWDVEENKHQVQMTTRWWDKPMQLPAMSRSGQDVINALIKAGYKKRGVAPSNVIDDATFVRRLYIDLVGRIPTVEELQAFVKRDEPDKREKLVDELLGSKAFGEHFAEQFDILLLGRPEKDHLYRRRDERGWKSFLVQSFNENKPWIETLSRMLIARNESKETRGANYFLTRHRSDHQQMAEAVSIAAFGLDIQCAQCHDHRISHEIKQADYWGLISIYSLSQNVGTKHGEDLAELAYAKPVQYADLKGKSYRPALAFLDGRTIGEQPKEEPKEHSPGDYITVPKFEGKEKKIKNFARPKVSRREMFVEKIVKESPRTSLAMVNRVWALLVGRGIVHPVIKIDSAHQPSHPELLKWLADDFAKHDYDVKRLVKQIVLSQTYQLDARPLGTPAPAEAFAYGLKKPLSAEVLHRSMLVATHGKSDVENTQLLAQVRELFPDLLPEEHNSKPGQALFFTNNPAIQMLVSAQPGNLTERLKGLKRHPERVKQAFLSVLGREPDQQEMDEAVAYLKAREGRLDDGLEQLVWALLGSAEFRLNH